MCYLSPVVAQPADEWLRERLPKKFLEPKYWFPSHFCPLLVDIARALRMPQRQFSFTSSTLFNDFCYSYVIFGLSVLYTLFSDVLGRDIYFVDLSFTLVKVAPRYLYICLSLFLMFAYLQTWFGFGQLQEEGEGVRGGGGVSCGILVLVFEEGVKILVLVSKKVVRILVLVFEEGVKWDSSVWGFLTVTLDQARRRTHWSWKMLKDTHLDWWNAENQKELLWKPVLVKENCEGLKGRGQSLSRGELKMNNAIHLLDLISWVICYWNAIAGWRVQEKSSKSTLVENILDYLVVGAGFEYPVDIFAKSGSIADRMAFILRSIPWYWLISAGS